MTLPETIEQIDAAWMTGALRQSFPDAVVTRLDIADVRHGTCTKVRVRLEVDGADVPETLMLKGGFEAHSRDWCQMHESEVRGYREVLPALGLPTPHCHFAAYDAGQRQGIIVMEDLVASNVRFCNPVQGETVASTRTRLTELARYHARGWDSANFRPGGSWGWMQENMQETRDYARPFLTPEVWDPFIALPRGAAVSTRFHDARWLEDALERLCVLSRQSAHCVLHGDTHLGNLYFTADGKPGFFDSLPGYGPGISEVAYHMVCALDVADRRESETDLVRHYLAELEGHGIQAPGLDEAMADYAAYLARAYFIFIINASEFQHEAVNTAYTARISTAMLDHDTMGRLAAIR